MNQTKVNVCVKCILPLLIAALAVFSADDKITGMLKDSKFTKAIEYIEKTYPPANRTVDIWLQYAEALDKSGADKQKVIAALVEAQKVQPSEPRVFEAMGEFYVRQKNYREAIRPLQKWYLLSRSVSAAEAMANCAMFLKDYDMARDAAESAIRIDSTTVEARKMLSFIYINEKDWNSAVEQLEFVVAKNKDDLNYWRKLALCQEELKNRDKLADANIHIAQLDGKDVRARTMLSGYYLDKKDSNSALPYLKELAVLTPDNAALFRNLYQISLTNNQKKDAVLYLRNFLILDSSDASAYRTLGDLQYEQKEYDEALGAYRRALKLNPAQTGIYKGYLAILFDKKLDDEVVAVIDKAVAAGEVDAPAFATAGMIYKNRNKCAAAIPFFQNALKTDVKNLTVLSALAWCQAKTGKTADALLNYQQVVMLDPSVVDEYKELGDLLRAQKKQTEAVEQYRKYLEKKGGDEEVTSLVGEYYYDKKQCKDALSYFEKITSPKMLTVTLCMKIGGCYFETENYPKAIEYYKKVWAKGPSKQVLAEMLKPLAIACEKTGASADAAGAYEAYVKLPGISDADASFKQAYLREASDRAGAIKLYQANITAFPKDDRNYTRLGNLLLDDKAQAANALVLLEKARGINGEDTLVLMKLCDAYHAAGNSAKELEAAQKLVTLQPDNFTANKRAGMILFNKKKFDSAVPYLEKMVASQPKDADAALMLAEAYMQTKDFARAVTTYESARQIQPENVKIKLSLIAAAEAAGQKDKAAAGRKELAELDSKMIAKDAKAVDARLRLADYYFDKQDFDAALPVYKDLSVLVPKNKDVFSRLVEISRTKGKDAETLNWLKQYVALDPSNAKAHAQLGDLYFAQKNTDGALTEYRQARKLDAALGGFYRNYGTIVLEKNLEDEAVPVLTTAIKGGETEPAMYVYLGKLYSKRKDFPSAIGMFKKASTDDPKNLELLSLLGDCQASNNEITNAVLTYQQVVMLNPDATGDYKSLGTLLLRQKKTDDGIKAYLKFLEKAADDTVACTVGLYHYDKKNYQDAMKYLDMVKNQKLHSREYLLALGDAAYQMKNCQKVCDVYSQLFTKKAPESMLKTILRPLGECYEKINDPAKAAEAYEAYVALPGVADADASYLRVFLKEKSDPKAAEAMYTANIKAYPKDSRNYLRLGMMYAANKTTLAKATGYLNQAAKLNTSDVGVLETLAGIWNTLGSDDKELDALTKLLAVEPQRAEANRRAGELYMKKKQYQKAIACLEIAAATAPQDTGIMLLLAEGYIATGRKDRGAELLTRVNSLQKNNPELMARIYQLQKELGNMKDAEEMIKSLITLKKDNKFRVWYAQDLITLKRLDEARAIADDIVKADPENLEGLMLQGRVLAGQGKLDDAIEHFKMVSYVKDDYAPANYERAEVYRRQNEFDRAESYYKKALAEDPKMASAEMGLALIYKAQNRTADYTAHLTKAKALDPSIGESSDASSKASPKKSEEAKPEEPKKAEAAAGDSASVKKQDKTDAAEAVPQKESSSAEKKAEKKEPAKKDARKKK